jgi:asparagine synthase (glutamine-hydrolysing)
MCGIAGYVGSDIGGVPKGTDHAMAQAILYRGRDAQGDWGDGRCVKFHHSRLSIIDLDTGGQPMADASGRYVIVFNGEIYNYQELRAEYEEQGATFVTRSDTEVILEGYKQKGRDVCRDLNGMFAFAIWDCRERSLFLGRDRLGKKPLFWTESNGCFYFASTLDAICELSGQRLKLCEASINLYGLIGGFLDDSTIYEGAKSLPAGCWAIVEGNRWRPEIHRYWRMSFGQQEQGGLAERLEEYGDILADAIRIRLRSDVPLALTFSGGVDSGTIAAICAKRLQIPLRCYTIDYHTDDDPSEETINAKKAAAHLNLEWNYVHFDYHEDLLPELQDAYRFYDQPCQQMAMVYSHRLYKAIRPFAKVVLSGNGADELFTGYVGDERIRQKGVLLSLLRWLRPALKHTSVSPYLRMPLPSAYANALLSRARSICTSADVTEKTSILLDAFACEAAECGVDSALDFKMFLSLTANTVDSNYRLPDISGLQGQVEVRSPFLDYRMVDFASRLPDKYKVGKLLSGEFNKFLPKRYYEKFLPKEIVWSAKKGMGWNLRWDRSIAESPRFHEAFKQSYDLVEGSGIRASHFRNAWKKYVDGVVKNQSGAAHANEMMNGFMLGMWLEKGRAG